MPKRQTDPESDIVQSYMHSIYQSDWTIRRLRQLETERRLVMFLPISDALRLVTLDRLRRQVGPYMRPVPAKRSGPPKRYRV